MIRCSFALLQFHEDLSPEFRRKRSHKTVKSLTEMKAVFLLSSLACMLPKKSTG